MFCPLCEPQVWFKNRRAKWRKQKREEEANQKAMESRNTSGLLPPDHVKADDKSDETTDDKDADNICVDDLEAGSPSPVVRSSDKDLSVSSPEVASPREVPVEPAHCSSSGVFPPSSPSVSDRDGHLESDHFADDSDAELSP